MEGKLSVWETLSKINVNEHTEQKNGLTYLSWSWAWGIVKGLYPNASYKVHKSKAIINGCENELNYFTDGKTCWVEVEATIEDITCEMYLPVMNYKNQSISVGDVTSFNINTSIQRCLAKCVAMGFGLGFYIYAGEDVPDKDKEENDAKKEQVIELATETQLNKILEIYTPEEIELSLKAFKKQSLKDLTIQEAERMIKGCKKNG